MGRRGPLPTIRDARGEPVTPAAAVAIYERRQEAAEQARLVTDVPPAPTGLLAMTRATWDAFWTSRAASRVDRGAQMSRLIRWIRDVDHWNRLQADLRPRKAKVDDEGNVVPHVPGALYPERPWLAEGSTGQITRHPSTELVDKLDQRIHRAEVEFGMTPYSEVRLGLAGVQGALTAEQLRKLLDERRRHRDEDPTAEAWAEGFEPA